MHFRSLETRLVEGGRKKRKSERRKREREERKN